jgi:NADPH-dependent 2,4-dienoyl-CoA reductase/sulfur reductase-like enzyme
MDQRTGISIDKELYSGRNIRMVIKNISADMVIFGGSLGGTLGAYSAAKSGKITILFEETDWIGGQLTSQAFPPDEHQWIEETGCTASYRA